MINIIHGQNSIASRDYFVKLIQSYQSRGLQAITLEKDILKNEKTISFQADLSLFGVRNVYILENYLKGKQSVSDRITEKIAKSKSEIILWEDDKRSAASLSIFPEARVTEFKLNSFLFKFLDTLASGNSRNNLMLLRQVLISESPDMVLALLGRRLADLAIPSGTLAPWQRQKLQVQLKTLNGAKLKAAIGHLLQIDLAQKTSSTALSLAGELERFVINI